MKILYYIGSLIIHISFIFFLIRVLLFEGSMFILEDKNINLLIFFIVIEILFIVANSVKYIMNNSSNKVDFILFSLSIFNLIPIILFSFVLIFFPDFESP